MKSDLTYEEKLEQRITLVEDTLIQQVKSHNKLNYYLGKLPGKVNKLLTQDKKNDTRLN